MIWIKVNIKLKKNQKSYTTKIKNKKLNQVKSRVYKCNLPKFDPKLINSG
ncbi:hypothetical protein THER_1343 [Thermodesulfovibrio sp. N1]|nr:hypothetical protein THER_1343 [Thermodesulfovibrio sp. N1]